MLHEFLTANREQVIARCRLKSARRFVPPTSTATLAHGIPLLLDQIIKTLQKERTAGPMQGRGVSRPSGCQEAPSELGATARQLGHELLQRGYSVDLVVHEYGDLCQAVTDLAIDANAQIAVDEFRTFNRCLDDAIAGSVTEFADELAESVMDRGAEEFRERLGVLAHEIRNLITTATHALVALRSGQVGLTGPTGDVLNRCLIGLGSLVERSLETVRSGGPVPAQQQLISLCDFIADVQMPARLEAQARECTLAVSPVDSRLAVDADYDSLFSAVRNLLQNAFKFTAPGTEVTLNAYATADRVRIDVEDHCGGWPSGNAGRMFEPFSQCGEDRSGLGLGLSICRRSVEANHGALSARNMPGIGCVFTIDLPRRLLAERFFRL